jgi:DNA-binding PadR family transcriptional regulator
MYVYRLTEKGRKVVEEIPLKDPKWRLPYSDVEFFVEWDVRDLMEYIYVNYPEYAVNSVIKDKLARKAEV